MDILITNISKVENYSSVELSNGKQTVYVGKGITGRITVLNLNAAHKAYKGSGKSFKSYQEAIENYKSSFMKAAITMAQAYV
jgi:hypothetical protein